MSAALSHTVHCCRAPWQGVYVTYTTSGRHFGRHWHDAYGFGLLEHGAHSSASGRGRVHAYAGDVITTNPGEVHDGRPLGGPRRSWRIVTVDVSTMQSLLGHPTRSLEIARPVIDDAKLVRSLHRLFRRIERWNGRRGAADIAVLACEEALVESCRLLMARHGASPVPREPDANVQRIRDRLADDPLVTPTLADLARMTGLSRYQVVRRFAKSYGLPPHSWLLRHRVERARGLIQAGCALATAAAKAGFADQSHMHRAFLRHFGFTPGVFRRAVRVQ